MAALVLMATPDLDHEKLRSVINGGLAGGLGGGGLVLVGMYGWRLEQLRRRPAGEMAEFALLHGWGDAAQARRTLLLAIARPMEVARKTVGSGAVWERVGELGLESVGR